MDTERNTIIQFMKQNGIWYAPLKGIILKDLYPQYGLREMSDNDLLYDSTFQNFMCEYMMKRGYKAISVGIHQDDIYHKLPIYNFELHRFLFREDNPKLYGYYKNVKLKLIKDKDNKYGFHFSDEDFYIYVIAHAYTHFYLGGTGIRMIIDIYLYINKHVFDWKYVEKELSKLGLIDFEKMCRRLSSKVFSKPEIKSIDFFR